MRVRVTEVLDYFQAPELVAWKLRVGTKEAGRISREAIKIGTAVDEHIKVSPNAVIATTSRNLETRNCIAAYHKWLNLYKPESVAVGERFTVLNEYPCEITGEPDLLIDGVLTDIKCSKRISANYWLQVNVYAHFLGYKRVAILRLDKESASYEYVVKDYDKSLVNVWLGLLRAYLYYKGVDSGGDELREVGSVKEVA